MAWGHWASSSSEAVRPPCLDAAGTNDTDNLDLSDAVSLLGFLFLGGAPPAAPGPQVCGPDPEGTSLGCESYETCGA